MENIKQYETFVIDKEETKKLLANTHFIPCECEDCKNYYKGIKNIPTEAKKLFENIGIDLSKCLELWSSYNDEKEKISHYIGYFPVSCKLKEAVSSHTKDLEIAKEWKEYIFGLYTFKIRVEYLKYRHGNTWF